MTVLESGTDVTFRYYPGILGKIKYRHSYLQPTVLIYSDLFSNVVGVFKYPILQQHDKSHFLDVITSKTMTSIPILIMLLLQQHHPQLAVVVATLIIGIAIILDEEIKSTVKLRLSTGIGCLVILQSIIS